jgi:uncharacterized membrane protein YqhA
MLENIFEKFLWSSRLLTLSAVIFGLLGALVLFVVASIDIFVVAKEVLHIYVNHLHPENFHEMVVSGIIGAVDLYLIAIVMLIFSFGIYDLFISDIDIAEGKKGSKILSITSLDALKDKLAKVIVMVLVVIFFKKAMYLSYNEAIDLVYLSVSILAISLGLYFLAKIGKK